MEYTIIHSKPEPAASKSAPQGPAFSWPCRIYYEDTDMSGVVYHAGYLRFFERARTEWLRAKGGQQAALKDELGIVFAVRHMKIDFVKPARIDDLIDVTVAVANAGRVSFTLDQSALRGGELIAAASVKVACLNAATFAPVPIPGLLLENIHA